MIRYFWPSDDEQLAGQFVDSHFDEDASWWAGAQKAGAVVALATALTLAATSTALATSVFSQSQDDPAGSLAAQPLVQEEYWQNSVPTVNWPQPSVIFADDTHTAFVEAFQIDEDFWTPQVPPVQATLRVALPFLDPEELPVGSFPAATNPVDDSAIWAPQVPPTESDWAISLFLDDGSWVPALEPDEDFLPVQALPAPYNWPQPAQPFQASDDDQLVVQFVAAEDPLWLQLTQPVPASLVWPQPWLFEQNESTNLVAFTTEDHGWPIPVPVPASNWILRQDAFEQHDATGSLSLVLDDGFQPLAIPGVPFPDQGALRPLQPWTFEQNEPAGSLRNNVDEDFWQNPVSPVVWPQPSVFIADESIETFVQAFRSDEDFNPNLAFFPPPLQASNFLAPFVGLAGERDEETPTLVTPPPIIPPFCPLPPLGPDADTSMSVFSNSRGGPTLALFCRICNSGKPLVVRADYAIWCQDCCAFVSKQDTYMGTVRAPGAFKNIF